MSEILLRIVEGARVVLYRHDPKNRAENVPARYDLFRYDGGTVGGTAALEQIACLSLSQQRFLSLKTSATGKSPTEQSEFWRMS